MADDGLGRDEAVLDEPQGLLARRVRAAAKNFKFVTIVTNPARYAEIARQVKENDCVDDKTRMELAQEAFAHTAAYDDMIQHYLAEQLKK